MADEMSNRIVQSLISEDFHPELVERSAIQTQSYTSFPLVEMLALGSAFEPLVSSISGVLSSTTDMVCRVSIPKGTHLAFSAKKGANIGAVFDANNHLVGQANIHPMNNSAAANSVAKINPYMMVIAVALMSINRKLDAISNAQKEILAFLELKERAALVGNLSFLTDIVNNYKYNWDNGQYKSSNHIKVLDIKHESEQSIAFFKSQIETAFDRKGFIRTDAETRDKVNRLLAQFGDYQLAVYLYAFSSFVDVLMLENFQTEYLTRIKERMYSYSLEYREKYSECYEKLKDFAKGSVESTVLRGVGHVSRFFGQAIKGIPKIGDTKIDEGLIETGDKLQSIESDKSESISAQLISRKQVDVMPFIENLTTIDNLYNNPQVIMFDSKMMYIAG